MIFICFATQVCTWSYCFQYSIYLSLCFPMLAR